MSRLPFVLADLQEQLQQAVTSRDDVPARLMLRPDVYDAVADIVASHFGRGGRPLVPTFRIAGIVVARDEESAT